MSMVTETNKSIFTEDELLLQTRVKDVRLSIVNKMTEQGVPETVGQIRVLNEVLSALDSTVQSSASNRLKYQDNQNKEVILDTVTEMLRNITSIKNIPRNTPVEELTDEYIPVDIVPGETEINPVRLEINQFIEGDE